jgi:uncharacterized membrane-anchored protein YjiN (DUF445 family)
VYNEVPLPDLPLLEQIRGHIANYVADRTVERVCANLTEVAKNSDHELRHRFNEWLRAEVKKLKESALYFAKGEEIKARLSNDPALGEYAGKILAGIRELLLADLSSGHSRVQAALEEFLKGVGSRIQADSDIRSNLNATLQKLVLETVETHRTTVGKLIANTVQGWDARVLVDKVEEAVGDDLQYIRISGTLVGGTVGLALHLFQKMAWH